jgi:hypothetical protein
MINPEPKITRVNKSFRLAEHTLTMMATLADLYGTTEVKIIEAIFAQYGPKLIEQRTRENQS